jgi:hypothetical protein
MAKMLTGFSDRHPELQFSRFIISQVPGSMPRSTTVHGVVESFFKSKKYIVPSVAVSPIFAGCVAAVYVGTGAGHFEPARNAMVFVVGSNRERPLDREDRKAYQLQLKHFLAGTYPEKQDADKVWEKLQSKAKTSVDNQGRPVIEVQVGERQVQIGVAANNVLNGNAPPELVRRLLEARLQSELRSRSAQGISETEVARDWDLLQRTIAEHNSPMMNRSQQRSENIRANRP